MNNEYNQNPKGDVSGEEEVEVDNIVESSADENGESEGALTAEQVTRRRKNQRSGQGFVEQIRAITGEKDVYSKVMYYPETIMEVDIGYKMENKKKKNIVLNFKTEMAKYKEINLSILTGFVRDIVVDEGISSIFSAGVKFTTARIRCFRPSEASVPYYQTPNQTVSGLYGKIEEGGFHLPYCIKFSRANREYHQRAYLYGIPYSVNYWDSPAQGTAGLLENMGLFSSVFLSQIEYGGIKFRSIGVHKLLKKNRPDLSEDYYPEPPVVIGLGYEGFVKKKPTYIKI